MAKKILNCNSIIIQVMIAAMIIMSFSASALESSQLSQQTLSNILSHQESLVKTIECTFEYKILPTNPDDIPLIHQVCDSRGEEYEGFIATEEYAQKRCCMKHWWRKDSKERVDSYSLIDYDQDSAQMRPVTINAFDGLIARSIAWNKEEIRGSIETMSGAHLDYTNIPDPFSFLYEFQRTPYSELIANGRNYTSSRFVKNGQEYTEIHLQHPTRDYRSFVLIFDDQNRLVERQIIFQTIPDPEPRVYERQLFSDYHEHRDDSGEIIWFPHTAVYHCDVGELPDGTPVTWQTRRLTIKKIRFNIPISDDIFEIKFPPGTRIWDGVNNLGWIDSIAKKAQDEVLSALVSDLSSVSQSKTYEAPANTSEQAGDVNSADEIAPASDRPLAYSQQSPGKKSLWAFCGVIVGLIVIAVGVIVLVHRRYGISSRS